MALGSEDSRHDPHAATGVQRHATPLRAIRERCLDCSGGSPKEVRLCPCVNCALWAHRFGKRPATVLANNPALMDPIAVRKLGGQPLTPEEEAKLGVK